MITVQPFTTSVLSTYKTFYILDKLPKNSQEIGVFIKTPLTVEPVDFVNVFSLHDGTLLAAWVDPFKILPLQNLVAYTNGKTQIINMTQLERIIDIYNKPVDSDFGTFSFGDSISIPKGDWRCYRGMYGFWQFSNDNHVDEIVNDVSELLVYESILNVSGTAHLVYVEATNKEKIAYEKINNSISPSSGRTLQETLRLIYEWYVVSEEPFNSQERPALAAKEFFRLLDITEGELESLSKLPSMQIANYIDGSETARLRPDGITEMSEEIQNIVFKRVSSLSLSALFKIHNIEDSYGLLEIEKFELDAGIKRFMEFYNVPGHLSIYNIKEIVEHCEIYFNETIGPFVHNQLRNFVNKTKVLDSMVY